MDDVAFVDASPLILLSRAGRLDLVRLAGGRIVVPRVVLDEIGAYGPGDPEWKAVRAAAWLTPAEAVPAPPEIQGWVLGPGETQVLALARAAPGSVAVLDDREARKCARALGVPVRGTLGLLLVAARAANWPWCGRSLQRGRSQETKLLDSGLGAGRAEGDTRRRWHARRTGRRAAPEKVDPRRRADLVHRRRVTPPPSPDRVPFARQPYFDGGAGSVAVSPRRPGNLVSWDRPRAKQGVTRAACRTSRRNRRNRPTERSGGHRLPRHTADRVRVAPRASACGMLPA